MSFSVSPAVSFREIDLSLVIGETASSIAAFAGKFKWGPVNEITLISGEDDLTTRFGKPTNDTYVDFFSASSFLAYTSGLNVVRIKNDAMRNAVTPASVDVTINNRDHGEGVDKTGFMFAARYPGELGNSITAKMCASAQEFFSVLSEDDIVFEFGGLTPIRSSDVEYTLEAGTIGDLFNIGSDGDFLVIDDIRYRVIAASEDAGGLTGKITLDRMYIGVGTPTVIAREWGYNSSFPGAPDPGRVHLVFVDTTGDITGIPGTYLEAPYVNMSLTESDIDGNGDSIHLETSINTKSDYVYMGGIDPTPGDKPQSITLTGGIDGFSSTAPDDYIEGYSLYADGDAVEVPLIIAGNAIVEGSPEGAVIAKYIIDNLVNTRRDGVAFISPAKRSVVNNRGREMVDVIRDRKLLGVTSYAMFDSGWKYIYDRYNNTFRWVPLNGDHAGIYARNDRNNEVWTSGAGTSKGVLKNVVKLAWSPSQAARDQLYLLDVNPVVMMPVVGPTIMGDKTMLGKNSAFSRISTRRLFIALEKSIATAAAELLFEFNDEFTQRRFVSMVEPFLRDIKGRRGIDDYRVVADDSVNTPQVVQNNRFVGQIFIKPKYSIASIRLDFVAVNAAASFDEVIGSV
jgi:hypothetical protein